MLLLYFMKLLVEITIYILFISSCYYLDIYTSYYIAIGSFFNFIYYQKDLLYICVISFTKYCGFNFCICFVFIYTRAGATKSVVGVDAKVCIILPTMWSVDSFTDVDHGR